MYQSIPAVPIPPMPTMIHYSIVSHRAKGGSLIPYHMAKGSSPDP